MTDKEKILTALRTCMPETEEEGQLSCEDCPYDSVCRASESVRLSVALVQDIRALLEGRSGRLVQ